MDDPEQQPRPTQPLADPAAHPHDPLAEYRVPESGTQPMNTPARDPHGRPCLRCQTPLRGAAVRTETTTRFRAASGSLQLLAGQRDTSCAAWVCPACGYVELVAVDPLLLFS
jgi:hypothetical protein